MSEKPEKIPKTYARTSKAKDGLLLPQNVKLPRCPAKMKTKAKGEHEKVNHLCDECRCKKTAGEGTSHLGVGYCYEHEQDPRYKKKAEKVVEAQTIAIRQGYPEKGYEYDVLDSEKSMERIRRDAEESGRYRNFQDEWNLAKLQLQKLMDSYDADKGRPFQVRNKTTGMMEEADDLEKANLLIKLVGAIGKIGLDQQKISIQDSVSFDEVKVWAGGVVALIDKYVDSPEIKALFVNDFAELLNEVNVS